MDRINLQSKDLLKENIEKIAELFPNVITEKDGDKKIDFEALKQELSDTFIEGNEKYQLTWPGKKSSILLANTPTNYSLKPIPEESVDFENTQNLYIEGDNLEVLKILQESYTGKIKCIYIDPPYNTGNDFVYKDDFKQSREEYALEAGELSEENERLVSNPETSGRYHSDWLSMMYPRLKLARNLLSEDGVIFISIDDNEQSNLKKICDEIFGEDNFIAQLIWRKKYGGGKGSRFFVDLHEYILVYSKELKSVENFYVKRTEEQLSAFNLSDEYVNERGKHYIRPLKSGLEERPTLVYPIICPDGSEVETQWICSKTTFQELLNEGRIVFKLLSSGKYNVYKKFYEKDLDGVLPESIFYDLTYNQNGKEELKSLFNIIEGRNLYFTSPKPSKLINYLIKIVCKNKNEIVLDFFSGSASSAHAAILLNAEDGGNRKYIMVQIPEKTPEDSEANKAGYKNICEIGKERIRRAAKKIKEETNADIDYGFRVYKLSEPIYENTKISPKEQTQSNLFEENIKDNVSNSEILTSVILDLGLELSLKTEEKMIDGKKVYLVEENYLFACFDKNLDLSNDSEMMKEIIKLKPQRIALLDSSFKDNQDKINFDNLIKQNIPECKGVKIV